MTSITPIARVFQFTLAGGAIPVLGLVAVLFVTSAPAAADAVEDFFRGKAMVMVISTGFGVLILKPPASRLR